MTLDDGTKGEKVSSFDDMIQLAGDNGARNYLIFFAASLTSLFAAMPVFSYQFLGVTPAHWCRVEPLQAHNWTQEQIKEVAIPYTEKNGEREYSGCEMYALDYVSLSSLPYERVLELVTSNQLSRNETVQCSSRNFEEHVQTIVNAWDLVCERRVLYSTTQAAVQVGILIGSLFMGFLVDAFGRCFVYRITITLFMICGLSIAASPNIFVFIGLRVLSSSLGMGSYMASFVLCMELCSVKQRTFISSMFVVPWAVGIMLTAFIAYIVRPWAMLQVAITVPAFILALNYWILPESPRWLIIKGRHKEALRILTSIAKSNKRELPSDQTLLQAMEHIQAQNTDTEGKDETVSVGQKILKSLKFVTSVFVDRKLCVLTLGVFFCWFSVALVYYGVSLGSTSISTNDYLYIFLSGVIEIPCYLLLWPMMLYLGRRNSLVTLFFLCAVSIFAVLALVLSDVNDDYATLRLILFLTGKFAITAAFHLIWVYTAELYPTDLRSLMVGEASSVARTGSIGSPYINDILGESTPWAPAAVFGCCSIAAGVVSLFFPETAGKDLPDSAKK